jgi:hypothetical protein
MRNNVAAKKYNDFFFHDNPILVHLIVGKNSVCPKLITVVLTSYM